MLKVKNKSFSRNCRHLDALEIGHSTLDPSQIDTLNVKVVVSARLDLEMVMIVVV